MESVKKLFFTCTLSMAKSKHILLFTLAVSVLLNLVLFLRIPLHTSHDIIRTYSELHETFAELQAESVEENGMLGAVERRTEDKSHDAFATLQASTCPTMTIHRKGISLQDTLCRAHLPAEDACQFTAKMFQLQPSIAKCHDQKDPPHQLCRITEIRNGNRLSAPEVKCDISVCLKTTDIRLFIVDPSDGNYLQLDMPGTVSNSDMEDVVRKSIAKTQENGFNFIFVDCTARKTRKPISQLLSFLPVKNIFKSKTLGNKVNVNVILLDSISRPHFFRSLRKTVSYLREKSEDLAYNAHIFDFELFQSVHGHTHENEHALFGGELYAENLTKTAKDSAPTNMERLFGIFKDAGYQTMAQNDMCWKSWYGFMNSFAAKEWPELQKIMKETIDSTGVTDASCRILQRSERTTSFSDDDDHQICYNGKHQHRYLFDHLTNYLQAVTTIMHSKPLFSYTETNVAHDDVGIRIQTLDQDLTELIDNMAQLPNTFTLIYADHGNTYTDYQVSMLEGRLEMYHPILFGILPKELGRKFGKNIVENLRTNQGRLLHLFDIRESLVELAKYDTRSRLNPVGIFREISKNRTCDDLKLSTPNFCICEGWDTPVESSTAQVALAEFAIGQLNNQIQNTLLETRGNEPAGESPLLFGSCQRLQMRSIKNVRQRQTPKGTMITTIDVNVQSGTIVDQEELFTVQVESTQKANRSSFDMKLMTFTRISHYSIYEKCADPQVPAKLCICNKRESAATKAENRSTIYNIFGKKSEIRKLKQCLLLVKRSYSENNGEDDFVGVEVYELANTCDDKQFSVSLGAETNNVRASTELPIYIKLPPRTVHFASIMMTEVGFVDSSLKLQLRVVAEDVKREDRGNAEKPSGRQEGDMKGTENVKRDERGNAGKPSRRQE